ncbi:hypothetical protein GCM10011571_30150 [Marinithermofilum abyssi]|uniref:Uncharacterized protein n=1 Tax=Marinithermofilum abyssi TaxID=1571185 RepID=A0A8J2VCF7_9BACL|nr:hypothetical protein GCM10011571_30150 [Marinithermofilum abyssi]
MSRRRKNTLAPENVGAESLTTDFEMARDAFLRIAESVTSLNIPLNTTVMS